MASVLWVTVFWSLVSWLFVKKLKISNLLRNIKNYKNYNGSHIDLSRHGSR